MNKKLIKLLAIILVLVLGTVGCAKENKNEGYNEELSEYNIQESNYIHLTMLFPKTINPILNRDKSVGHIMSLIYDSLFEIDENYNVEPRLVENYTKSSDGKSINIKLKSGTYWHNNKELTSSDINFTIDLIKKNKDNPYLYLVENIKSIQINDSKNFIINLKENDPFIIDKLIFPIVSKDKLGSLNTDELNNYKNNLLGNGPYKIKDYVDRQYMILERNEKYFGNLPDNRKEIFVKMVPNKESQTQMVLSLDSDIASVTLAELSKFEKKKEFNIRNYEGRNYDMIIFNYDNQFLNNINFRKAIISSIDRKKLLKEAYVDNVTLSNFPLNTTSKYYNKHIKGLDYNKENAIDYLIQSLKSVNKSLESQKQIKSSKDISNDLQGITEDNPIDKYSDLKISKKDMKKIIDKIELKIIVSAENGERIKAANIIKQNLSSIGIKSIVKELNEKDLNESLNSKKYDLAVLGYSLSSIPDARGILESFDIKDKQLSTYIKSLGNSKSEDETKQAYNKIQKYVVEQGLFISLGILDNFIVSNKRLEGEIHPNDFDTYKGISNLQMSK